MGDGERTLPGAWRGFHRAEVARGQGARVAGGRAYMFEADARAAGDRAAMNEHHL